jgi:Holliday junction resolvase RusA-like endonuclease
MLQLTIEGRPIPWRAHQGSGKRSFNPLYKEREYVRWQIRNQTNEFVEGALDVLFIFYFAIPKSFSKKKALLAEKGLIRPTTRPDSTNLCKFMEDCLQGVVFEDDCQIVDTQIRKYYSLQERTLIRIFPLEKHETSS